MKRVGIDIGGTFTDFAFVDEETGEIGHFKNLSTPKDPSVGVMELLKQTGISGQDIGMLVHGSTVVINTFMERKGAKTGLIATKGFRDILELRRCARTHLLDPFFQKPWMFIPRRLRVEVDERTLGDGSIRKTIDPGDVREVIQGLIHRGIESVAVALLNSYVNPDHEKQIKKIIAQEFPDLFCTLSCELLPEIREFERTSTTAINAYVMPVFHKYIVSLIDKLKAYGIRSDLYVMQSNGGMTMASEAIYRPVHVIDSGPAAGAVAAAYWAGLSGYDRIVAFDMGGTTTKAVAIEGGEVKVTTEYELLAEMDKPGSGWPLYVPIIDLKEVGAGGGSIAWLEAGGGLRVGPMSAGADPGPVCYNLGGIEPTITDANAVLGRLETLLGGGMKLDLSKARKVILEKIAKPLGLSVDEAAAGITEIANAMTADAIREVTMARGVDPRDLTLVAFGGAGPMHAAAIMEELSIPESVIPPVPGTFSAFGMLCTDLRHDFSQTTLMETQTANIEMVNNIYRELEGRATETLRREKVGQADVKLFRSVDMRYLRQAFQVSVPVPGGNLGMNDIRDAERQFHRTHMDLYTYADEKESTEMITFRVRAVGGVSRPKLKPPEIRNFNQTPKEVRKVYFQREDGYLDCSIYWRDDLGPGSKIDGPAILEEKTSTTLVPPLFTARVDEFGNIILTRRG